MIAPRLQIVLQLWTSLREEHWHASTSVAAGAPAGAVLFRSRHLHLHKISQGRRPERLGRRPLPERAEPPGGERIRFAELLMRPAAARHGPRAGPAPSTAGVPPGASPREARASRLPRRADSDLPAGPGARPRSAALRLDLPAMRGARRPVSAATGTARALPPASAAARPAWLRRLSRGELVMTQPSGARRVSRAGMVRRDRPLALLELAGVAAARARSSAGSAAGASGRRRPEPAPPLDYRHAAPPAAAEAAEAAEPTPRAAPAPQAPVIDIDALSRDVISRIEKRLRIERERHGRI